MLLRFETHAAERIRLADLEVIEIPEGQVGAGSGEVPREPLRWLLGEEEARQAAFARNEEDGTGTAGLWRAFEALGRLSQGGERAH